jgi:hypothetical protein
MATKLGKLVNGVSIPFPGKVELLTKKTKSLSKGYFYLKIIKEDGNYNNNYSKKNNC